MCPYNHRKQGDPVSDIPINTDSVEEEIEDLTNTIDDLAAYILTLDDSEEEELYVPEWKVRIKLRSMSAKERASMLKATQDAQGDVDPEKMYPAIVVRCALHPKTGKRLFNDSNIAALGTKSAAAIERVAKRAMEMSGMGSDAVDKAGKSSS